VDLSLLILSQIPLDSDLGKISSFQEVFHGISLVVLQPGPAAGAGKATGKPGSCAPAAAWRTETAFPEIGDKCRRIPSPTRSDRVFLWVREPSDISDDYMVSTSSPPFA